MKYNGSHTSNVRQYGKYLTVPSRPNGSGDSRDTSAESLNSEMCSDL